MPYNRTPRRLNYEPAMSFDEIARELGMKTSTVQNAYIEGMAKLIANRDMAGLRRIRELIAYRDSLRTSLDLPMSALPPIQFEGDQ